MLYFNKFVVTSHGEVTAIFTDQTVNEGSEQEAHGVGFIIKSRATNYGTLALHTATGRVKADSPEHGAFQDAWERNMPFPQLSLGEQIDDNLYYVE